MAKNIKEIESKLWKAADTLRGNMSAEDYMHTILGVLSLKYISDKSKKAEKQVKSRGLSLKVLGADEFYYNYGAFILSEESTWEYIQSFANTPQIGEKIDDAFVSLEKENEMLRGIFNKNYNKEGIDQIKLGEVVRIFSDEDFSGEENEDIIGRIYEYFLGNFFRDRGQKGGEFYTPTSIVQLMVNILKPTKGTIYDPACGTGGILVQSKRFIEEHDGNVNAITVYGQEYNNVTWKLAKLNLVLNNFPLVDTNGNGVLGETSADTFSNDQHRNKKFDFVMANPPFNIKKYSSEGLAHDPRWKWGTPPSGNANYAWISHMVSKLNTNGKAAIVLANGSLSSSQKAELEIRKNFIKENKVDAIIELPSKLFYTTGIPACIWIFNNNKKTKNVLMISSDAVEGNMVNKKLRELTKNDIKLISSIFDKHEKGEVINEKGKFKTVSLSDLEEKNYSFVPGRYVGFIENIIDRETVKLEIKETSNKITKLFKEFNELAPKVEEAIKKALDFENED